MPVFDPLRPLALDLLDKEGRRVVWYKDSYDIHVAKRPEIRRNLNRLKEALLTPSHIERIDKYEEHRYSKLVRYGRNGYPLYFKVIVLYNHLQKFGSIQTAILCPD